MTSPAGDRRSTPVWLGAVTLVTLLLFAPSIGFDFLHSDDDVNVFQNEHIRDLSPASLKWMFTDFEQAVRFKPLSWLGWALIHQVAGLHPAAYHLANVLLHAINAALLFLLLRRTAGAQQLPAICAFATLLWSLHPLRVEPVAWVTGFPYHLSTFFLLLSLGAYLRVSSERTAFRQSAFWISVAAYALSLATYPIVLGYVFALIALDQTNASGFSVRKLTEKIPYVALAGCVTILTVLNRYRVESAWGSVAEAENYDFVRHAMQAGYVWIYYLWKHLFPLHQTAIPMDLIENSTFGLPFTTSAIVLATAFIALAANFRKRPGVAFAFLAYLGILIPVLGLTEDFHFPSDRYGMLPGILLSFVIVKTWSPQTLTRVQILATVSALLLLSALSVRYLPVWEDDITYFSYHAERLNENIMRPVILERLGDAHVRREELREAIGAYELALNGDPRYVPPGVHNKLHTARTLLATTDNTQ